MAYFNNAFQKTLLSLGTSPDEVGDGTLSAALLATEGAAVTAVLNPTTFQSDYGLLAAGSNIMLAMTSVLSQDKIGPFHGGYQTTSKTKMINPKYVQSVYQVNCCEALTNVIGVGAINPSGAFDATDCCRTFECDETYDLRIDLKGSPALRYLNHNMYYVASAYTGCCPDDDPTATVSSGVVMQGWINDIIHTPTFFGLYDQWDQRMINIALVEICDDAGDKLVTLYLPDAPYFTDGILNAVGTAFIDDLTTINSDYTDGVPQPLSTLDVDADCCYGLIINPTAVETMFDNCTFETTDKYEIEPLIGQVSMLDQTGDPCQFEGVCLHDGITPGANGGAVLPAIRTAVQVQGSGEQVLRDFILSQSYEQNFVASNDLRIREITLGNDIVSSVPRNALYSSVYILHSVPRFNNPTGVFDNDQYLLRIILDDETCLAQGATPTASQFVIDLVAWARAANNDSVADAAMVYGCCASVTVDSVTP
jgi:hypothetical protein